LISAVCQGGTRVVRGPSFPQGFGGEYSTYRTYSLAVEGDVPLRDDNIVLAHEESLEFEGTGGPIRVWIPVARGSWVRQPTAQAELLSRDSIGPGGRLDRVSARPRAPLARRGSSVGPPHAPAKSSRAQRAVFRVSGPLELYVRVGGPPVRPAEQRGQLTDISR